MQEKDGEIINATIEIVERVLLQRDLRDAQGIKNKDTHSDLEEKISSKKDDAMDIANRISAKSRICAGMKSAAGNVKEITKIVAASLFPLSLAGTITVPLTPMLLAAVTLIILDSGIEAYCDGIEK